MNEYRRKLLDGNIIAIEGTVGPDMGEYVSEAMAGLASRGNPDIEVRITSNGGDVSIGLHIFDAFDTYPGKIRGRVCGFARSMAVVILQGCTTREATKHAAILIHHVSRKQVSLDVINDPEKFARLKADLDTAQEKIYAIFESRTGKGRKEIIDACLPDTDMTAQEALQFGLIAKITPSVPKED